ncbi:unnamed protein product, partial [Prorocentrum cordatum]
VSLQHQWCLLCGAQWQTELAGGEAGCQTPSQSSGGKKNSTIDGELQILKFQGTLDTLKVLESKQEGAALASTEEAMEPVDGRAHFQKLNRKVGGSGQTDAQAFFNGMNFLSAGLGLALMKSLRGPMQQLAEQIRQRA